ncbi:MAG: hypothetical protein HY796_11885 [Elusimicrobia bacterium]|nr:hypothetical protein [Elusimicrobiota bacterium]
MRTIKKITVAGLFVCAVGFLLVPGQPPGPVTERILETVEFKGSVMGISTHLWEKYEIPIIAECDTEKCWDNEISYSAGRATVREMLDAIISPKYFLLWREEEGVIHIIEKSLDARPDYPLNAPIERFSGIGNYADLVTKAIEQIKPLKYPELELSGGPSEYPYKDYTHKIPLCEFKVKARNTTLRRILDRIVVKAKITYLVTRLQDRKTGTYYFDLHLWGTIRGGLSSIPPPEPHYEPCPWVEAGNILYASVLFSFLTVVIVIVFPYIMALPSRVDKDRVRTWRIFFGILAAAYLPGLLILYAAYISSSGVAERLRNDLWVSYYPLYVLLVAFLRKGTNLRLGWFAVIAIGTVYYLINSIYLVETLKFIAGAP